MQKLMTANEVTEKSYITVVIFSSSNRSFCGSTISLELVGHKIIVFVDGLIIGNEARITRGRRVLRGRLVPGIANVRKCPTIECPGGIELNDRCINSK